MRILLTGASGMIGRELCLELLKQGHEVVAFSRNPEQTRSRDDLPIEWLKWDAEIPGDMDGAIFLAGENIANNRWSKKFKEKLRVSRVETTQKAFSKIKVMKGKKPSILIQVSAIGYYGNTNGADEESPRGKGFLADLTEEWENAFLSSSIGSEENPRKVVVRLGVVLSRFGGAMSKLLPVFRAHLGGVLGGGQQWMSWIHVKDAVRVLIWSLQEAQVKGVVNAVTPHPVTNETFTKELTRALGVFGLFGVPAGLLKLSMGEQSSLLLDSQKIKPKKLIEAEFRFLYTKIDAAFSEIVSPFSTLGDEIFEDRLYLDSPIEKVFEFFLDAKNLESITPSFLHFKIDKIAQYPLQKGSEIHYSLKVHGVSLKWVSRIARLDAPNVFVDEQTKGPYAKWHHTHEFESLGEGTLISDKVLYRLPAGFLGKWVASRFVRKDIEAIFLFRKNSLRRIFPKIGSS